MKIVLVFQGRVSLSTVYFYRIEKEKKNTVQFSHHPLAEENTTSFGRVQHL